MDQRLYEAAIRGDKGMLLDLVQEDASMESADPFLDRVMRQCIGEDNPLHLGAQFGHVDFVTEILSRKPEMARQLNSRGLSPLHLASERGHVEVVKALLRTVADICFVRDRDGRIPLHLAAIKGRVDVLEELVEARKITAWFLTNEREPILHLCANHDQMEALKKLVKLVADDKFVKLKDSNDNTILHLLSGKKHIEMIVFFLYNTSIEIEINALNVNKFTALDVVEQARWEPGYLILRHILGRKGAKRANDFLKIQPAIFQWKSTKRDSKWLKEMKPALLVVAVLIATVTFEAVCNPPGGLWQENYPSPGSENTINGTLPANERVDMRQQHHTAGEVILSYTRPLGYYFFSMFNEVGFFASSSIILFIVCGSVIHPTFLRWILMVSTCTAFASMLMAYFVGVLSVGSRGSKTRIYLSLIFLLIYKVALVGPYVRYLIERVGSIMKKMQREGEGNQQNVVIQMTTDH